MGNIKTNKQQGLNFPNVPPVFPKFSHISPSKSVLWIIFNWSEYDRTNQWPFWGKRRELQPGFICDNNRKRLLAGKQGLPQSAAVWSVWSKPDNISSAEERAKNGTNSFSLLLTGYRHCLANHSQESRLAKSRLRNSKRPHAAINWLNW